MYAYLLFLGDWWSGAKLTVFAEEDHAARMEGEDKAENALILMNHHTELDWLYTWMVSTGDCFSPTPHTAPDPASS